MTPAVQKWLALAGAVLVVAVFVAANAHLLAVAIGSQPGWVQIAGGGWVSANHVSAY